MGGRPVAGILCRSICKKECGEQKRGGDQDVFHDLSEFLVELGL
jgi:hypothetical protein